jgi:DNA-binding SARP family transcriptional activator
MNPPTLQDISKKKYTAKVQVYTMGKFEVYVDGQKIPAQAWKRDKSLQLFQFMIIACHRKALHKEQIIDRLWEDEMDDQGFKVALHGISKVIEPDKKSHGTSSYIERNTHTYSLITDDIWVDVYAFDALIAAGNRMIHTDPAHAEQLLREAIILHAGVFLPDRIYEDWSADERERIQLSFLNASTALAEMVLESNPTECIQLCQDALLTDITWEDAYRLQMAAFFAKGNRPMAIKTYRVCEKVLDEEMGVKPLPETNRLYQHIINT